MSHGVWLVVCLVTGVKQTNNWIPFLRILWNILVSIPECPNSARIKGTRMKKIAGLPAKFYSTGFCWNDWIPAGIRGALIRPPE